MIQTKSSETPGPLQFWTDVRVKRVLGATFLGLLLALFSSFFLEFSSNSIFARGDFPPFYSAGSLVVNGEAESLYNQEKHAEIQKSAWPEMSDEVLLYWYPPAVALFFAPLALLPPFCAKAVFSALLLLALFFAVLIVQRSAEKATPQHMEPCLKRSLQKSFGFFVLLLAFAPNFSAIFAGQNVTLLLFSFALGMYFREKKPLLSGFFFGLLLCKPQFGVWPLFFFFIAGWSRVLAGALISAFFLFFLGVFLLGFSWPTKFLSNVQTFSGAEHFANMHQMVSPIGFGSAVAHFFSLHVSLALILGILISTIVFVLTARAFYFLRRQRNPEGTFQTLCLLLPAMLILSPHTLYYDLGLLSLPIACLKSQSFSDRQIWGGLSIYLGVGILVLLKAELPFQPLAVFPLFTYAIFYKQITS